MKKNENKTRMIEKVLQAYNMHAAYRQVVKNKGSAGVDGIKVSQLESKIRKDYPQLKEEIRNGRYLPQSILGVEIPKGKGKTRLLGIPTTTDRMLQQAVAQVLMAKWEPDFSNNSFGFLPNATPAKRWEKLWDISTQVINTSLIWI